MEKESQRKIGEIQVIFGPMFSGKTTELLRRLRRYHLAAYRCLVIKYAMDNRYSESDVSTHDRVTLPAVKATELLTVDKKLCENCDVIGIDEGQFFPDLVVFSERMANSGKTVIVAALDGTYMRDGFGDVLNLVPLAENIVKLTAVCMICFGEAAFTFRKTTDKEVEVIGGTEKYMALCRPCYNTGSVEANKTSRKRKTLGESQTTPVCESEAKIINVVDCSFNEGVQLENKEN